MNPPALLNVQCLWPSWLLQRLREPSVSRVAVFYMSNYASVPPSRNDLYGRLDDTTG